MTHSRVWVYYFVISAQIMKESAAKAKKIINIIEEDLYTQGPTRRP